MPATHEADRPLTTVPATVPPVLGNVIAPEFVRLPRQGAACPFSGLSRAKLNQLVLPNELNGHQPPVKSISLRPKGAKTGVRLISYASLMAYLRGLMSSQEQKAA